LRAFGGLLQYEDPPKWFIGQRMAIFFILMAGYMMQQIYEATLSSYFTISKRNKYAICIILGYSPSFRKNIIYNF